MNALSIVAAISLPVGLGLGSLGFFVYRRVCRFRRSAASAEGTVVDFRENVDDDGDTSYYPIFRFQDTAGQEHQICSDVGSNPPGFKKGYLVSILYDPNNPANARIDTFSQLWLGPVILLALGGTFALLGLVLLLADISGK